MRCDHCHRGLGKKEKTGQGKPERTKWGDIGKGRDRGGLRQAERVCGGRKKKNVLEGGGLCIKGGGGHVVMVVKNPPTHVFCDIKTLETMYWFALDRGRNRKYKPHAVWGNHPHVWKGKAIECTKRKRGGRGTEESMCVERHKQCSVKKLLFRTRPYKHAQQKPRGTCNCRGPSGEK